MFGRRGKALAEAFLKRQKVVEWLVKTCQNVASGLHFWSFYAQIPSKL
jgi:hypothetical protein